MIDFNHAATTRTEEEVLQAMQPYFTDCYSNPSGTDRFSQQSARAVERARRSIAAFIHGTYKGVYFTSGGTEGDNWVFKQFLNPNHLGDGGFYGHLILSDIEHHAIINTAKYMESLGFQVTFLSVDREGLVDPKELEQAITDDTLLVSVMTANNEIGTIEPIAELAEIAHAHGVPFHTDAVQAAGHIPLDVEGLGVDFLTASAHKFGGPKGVGFLYARPGSLEAPFMHGGAQERELRAGTLNVPGIVGLGKAAERIKLNDQGYVSLLRNAMFDKLEALIPEVEINGSRKHRLPGNVHITLPGLPNETALVRLDQAGIAAAAGSACASGAAEPSRVLTAIGRTRARALESLRFTLDSDNTLDEVNFVCEKLAEIYQEWKELK